MPHVRFAGTPTVKRQRQNKRAAATPDRHRREPNAFVERLEPSPPRVAAAFLMRFRQVR